MPAWHHFPIFMITVPLVCAVLLPMLGYFRSKWVPYAAAVPLGISTLLGLLMIGRIPSDGYLSYRLGGWAPPWGIEIRLDFMGYFLMMIVCGISLLALIASWRYISKEVTGGRLIAY